MKKETDNIRIGCWGIITNNKNQVLLLKRRKVDYWEEPGGKLKVGELLEKGVTREIYEETGINTKVADFLLFDEVFWGDSKQHWITFNYHLKHVSGEVKNMEPEKHEDVRWFSFSDLPKNIGWLTMKSINKYLEKNKQEEG